uniref:Uncharacterized protein n=1 Tax=Strongyloides stercoralis TaxID=6248 RepID=A0AAF5DDR1_STRER
YRMSTRDINMKKYKKSKIGQMKTQVLHINVDIQRPINQKSHLNCKYVLSVIDDFSRYAYVVALTDYQFKTIVKSTKFKIFINYYLYLLKIFHTKCFKINSPHWKEYIQIITLIYYATNEENQKNTDNKLKLKGNNLILVKKPDNKVKIGNKFKYRYK